VVRGSGQERGERRIRCFGSPKRDQAHPTTEGRLVVARVRGQHGVEVGESLRGAAEPEQGEAVVGARSRRCDACKQIRRL
jgi:hypothetical protein